MSEQHFCPYVPCEEEWHALQEQARAFDLAASRAALLHSDAYVAWLEQRPYTVKHALHERPFHGFYTDSATRQEVLRIYAVGEKVTDGSCVYHAARAGYLYVYDALYEMDELVPVAQWSDAHLERIRCCGEPATFLMPDGWATWHAVFGCNHNMV